MIWSASTIQSSSWAHGLTLLSPDRAHKNKNGKIQAETAESSDGGNQLHGEPLIQHDFTERELISIKRPYVLPKKIIVMAEASTLKATSETAIATKTLPHTHLCEKFDMETVIISEKGSIGNNLTVEGPSQNGGIYAIRDSLKRKSSLELEELSAEKVGSSQSLCTLEDLNFELEKGNLKGAVNLLEELSIEVPVSSTTYALLLKQCIRNKSLPCGKRVHDHIKRQRLQHNTFLGNHLINMYRHCGDMNAAASVFDELDRKNVFSWTIIISAYAQHGHHKKALELFNRMQDEKVKPDKVTVSTIISACSSLLALEQGRRIHAMIQDGSVESDIVVETSLVDMYVKCGSLEEAQQAFNGMRTRNVVAWSIMIMAYAQHKYGVKALNLFERMNSFSVKPNEFTLVGALSACATVGSLANGYYVHTSVVQHGYEFNVTVGNALIHMYGKCGTWEAALKVFSKMREKDVITWTSMLDAYMEYGRSKDTLQLFEEMQWEGIIPDKVTFLSILGACADLAALEQGKRIHTTILSRRLHTDEMLGSALIHMYGKCGSVESVQEVFDNIQKHNVHTWTALITVYSQHGFWTQALVLFSRMLHTHVKPNEITFVSILSACSHGGFITEGWRCFNSISRDYGIAPTLEHYACVVNMLGRAGYLKEAEDFIYKMPIEPDVLVWRTMLSACTVYNDMERGKRAAEKCILLEPGYGAPYVLLSNIYASCGLWEEVARIRRLMEENGAKKQKGRSSIEIKDRVHDFVVGDDAHPRIAEIREELDKLYEQMEQAGYVPEESRVVLHDVEEEIDPLSLKYHSERLAIVFGHIMTPEKTSIRVIKNLRVCVDCHCAIKFMSKILGREIVVRDSHQFHRFKDGVCSCRDYW